MIGNRQACIIRQIDKVFYGFVFRNGLDQYFDQIFDLWRVGRENGARVVAQIVQRFVDDALDLRAVMWFVAVEPARTPRGRNQPPFIRLAVPAKNPK